MSTAPLPGPHGLYTVSAMPVFLADSARVGWAGAYFTDIVAVPQGRVDHGHARLCIRRTLQQEWRRRPIGGSWQAVAPTVDVLHVGDEERFEWCRGGRAQFLFISDEQVARVIDRAPRRLALRGMQGEAGSRLPGLLLDALLADLAQDSPSGPAVGDSLIAALLAHVAGAAPAREERLGARGHEQVLELIEARCAEPLPLELLARTAGLSVRQFTRAFRGAQGCSPHQYILQRRVALAQRLIREGHALADVAARCGFADQSQLTRTFVRCTGLTPGRFRAA